LPLARGLRSHPQPALGGSMDKSLGGSRAPTSGGRAAWDGLPGGGSLGKWRDSPTAPMSAGNVNFQFEYECELSYKKMNFWGPISSLVRKFYKLDKQTNTQKYTSEINRGKSNPKLSSNIEAKRLLTSKKIKSSGCSMNIFYPSMLGIHLTQEKKYRHHSYSFELRARNSYLGLERLLVYFVLIRT